MAEQIFDEFGPRFDITLVPSSGGVFEVTAGGDLVFSKKATGRHAAMPTTSRTWHPTSGPEPRRPQGTSRPRR